MRIITLNANGVRSAERKGLSSWLDTSGKWDVLCLQELKAQIADIPSELSSSSLKYAEQADFFPAERKGYSGTGLIASKAFKASHGFKSPEFDAEGRYLQADFGNLTVVSLYVPSGSMNDERQASKYRFMDAFLPFLKKLVKKHENLIVCGDINIAHKEIDLKNWRSNRTHSGFLPEERAWLDRVFAETGLVDTHRALDPRPEQYTWWSNRGQAWAKNVGWRLDYQFSTPAVAQTARAVSVYKDQRFSDHAPLVIDYDFEIESA
jgi:exodeoxyribonuclease-3